MCMFFLAENEHQEDAFYMEVTKRKRVKVRLLMVFIL